AERGPELAEPRRERRERRARVEVRLFGEVEPVTETPGEVGLEGRNGLGTDALEVAGAAGKLGDLGGVAAMRHDQGAVHHGARKALLPPGDAFRAELRNEGPRALELAPGREHPPAYHQQPAAPSRAPRSSTSTETPRSASSSAHARPATPAPMTVTRTRQPSRAAAATPSSGT